MPQRIDEYRIGAHRGRSRVTIGTWVFERKAVTVNSRMRQDCLGAPESSGRHRSIHWSETSTAVTLD